VPEGDTVFLAGRRLDEALAGQRLVRGELRHPRLSTADLSGRMVVGVRSVGKHLLVRFDDGRALRNQKRGTEACHDDEACVERHPAEADGDGQSPRPR
jgi:endonuclease-8